MKTAQSVYILMTLLLLAACSQSEVVTTYEQEVVRQVAAPQGSDESGNVPVIFNTTSASQATTREAGLAGSISTTADLAREGFSVFAYHTGTSTWEDAKTTAIPDFMYNQHVTGVEDPETPGTYLWQYDPLKYWPNNDNEKVSFFAYGSHAEVTQHATDYSQDATGLSSGIVSISGNAHQGVPYLNYSLGAETVSVEDMRDLLYAAGQTDKVKGDVVLFSFNHALSAFGFGVCGVFNEVSRGANSGDGYLIDDNSYIRIEEIEMKVTLPTEGKMSLDGTWTTTPSSEQEVTFHMNASNIAENLRYTDYVVRDEGEIDVEQTTAKATELLSYGVGRYKAVIGESLPDGFSLADGDKIPNSGTNAIYQKVGLTGNAQQNLFYYIPASSTGSITFNFTITYHTLTRDARMLYGLGDVKNVVSNSATVSVTGGDAALGKILIFNLQLGMSKAKFDVSMAGYYWDSEGDGSTPYNGSIYYSIPK